MGGPTYNEATNRRLVGVPIEFDNVCEMMNFIRSKKKLNVMTQVIGLAVGKKHDLFPLNCKYLLL